VRSCANGVHVVQKCSVIYVRSGLSFADTGPGPALDSKRVRGPTVTPSVQGIEEVITVVLEAC